MALVALADHIDTDDIGGIVQTFIPYVQRKGSQFHLDGSALRRGNSEFQIQDKKCKAYHLSGGAGRGFIRSVRKDFDRLVSKGRSFLDPALLQDDRLPNLVRAGHPERRLTVLRDIDRLRLEHFELAIRHRSLERISVLVDRESAAQLVKQALGETVGFLRDANNWVEHIEVAFRMLRIGVRAGDWHDVEALLEYMDGLWRDSEVLRVKAPGLFHRGEKIRNQSAVLVMRNYLHARRVEAICSAILPTRAAELPVRLRDGIVERTKKVTWRALVSRGRILAAADLRAFDREDDGFDQGRHKERWGKSDDFGRDDESLGEQLRRIEEFLHICKIRGDSAWGTSAPRLVLCTRPPSYF